jgi:predicted transposase/invertase (TIGR01784 family)
MAKKKPEKHQDYDIVLKDLFVEIFLPFISRQLGIKMENIFPIDTTIKRTQERRIDFACKVLEENEHIIQVEFQTSNDRKTHYRMLNYYETLSSIEELPINQLLVYVGKDKLTMKNRIEHPNLKFNYKIIDVSTINYHELVESNFPEAIIVAILSDFQKDNPEEVISLILKNLRRCVKENARLQRYFVSLEILSELRNLDSETIKQIRDMPITGIDIRKTYFYQEAVKAGREDGLSQGLSEGLSQGLSQGLSEGLSQGLSQAEAMIENTAINMLKKGMTVDVVVECTGMSLAKVKALLKKINK